MVSHVFNISKRTLLPLHSTFQSPDHQPFSLSLYFNGECTNFSDYSFVVENG